MKSLALLTLVFCLSLVCIAQNQSLGRVDQNNWQRLNSTEGRFNVLMPGPYKEATSTVKLSVGNVVKHDYVNATKNRIFAVSYIELGGPITKEKDLKSMLQDSCKRFNVVHHNVIGAAYIEFKDHPGIQCSLDNGGGVEVIQVVVAAERMYILNAYTNREDTPSTDCMTFLHSFGLGTAGTDGPSPTQGKSDSSRIVGQYSESVPPDEKNSNDVATANNKSRADEAVLALGDVGSIEVNGKNDLSSKLQLLSNPRPDYTTFAREHKVAGMVLVEAEFTTEGVVKNVRVIRPLGYGLDEMAIHAVYKIKFRPAERDGKKVSLKQRIKVSFTLL